MYAPGRESYKRSWWARKCARRKRNIGGCLHKYTLCVVGNLSRDVNKRACTYRYVYNDMQKCCACMCNACIQKRKKMTANRGGWDWGHQEQYYGFRELNLRVWKCFWALSYKHTHIIQMYIHPYMWAQANKDGMNARVFVCESKCMPRMYTAQKNTYTLG